MSKTPSLNFRLKLLNISVLGLVLLFWSLPSEGSDKECVILLHGLARTSRSFDSMESYLKNEGYEVFNIDYPSRQQPIEDLAPIYVQKGIRYCSGASRFHIVTHSMGGILTRYYFAHHRVPRNLGHVVMLAPPNKGSEVVDSLKDIIGFNAWNGPAGSQLGTDENSIPNQLGPVNFSLGIIAGNWSTGSLLAQFINGPSDGKVSVESTKIQGMNDHITLPHSHTFIMNKADVKQQVKHFLQNGSFKPTE